MDPIWTVIYIAPNKSVAEMLKEALSKEGLLVMLRSGNAPHVGESGHVEVLVPEAEVEEAHEILTTILGR